MSLPKSVDPVSFAKQGREFSGKLAIDELPRLRSVLVDNLGFVNYALEFSVKDNRRFVLSGHLDAEVTLICQRCLQAMAAPLSVDFNLAVVLNDEQAKALPGDYEPLLVETGEISLLCVIEDELLLALPLVPKHEELCAAIC